MYFTYLYFKDTASSQFHSSPGLSSIVSCFIFTPKYCIWHLRDKNLRNQLYTNELFFPKEKSYLCFATSDQCSHEGNVTSWCKITISCSWLRSCHFRTRCCLACQARLIDRKIHSLGKHRTVHQFKLVLVNYLSLQTYSLPWLVISYITQRQKTSTSTALFLKWSQQNLRYIKNAVPWD